VAHSPGGPRNAELPVTVACWSARADGGAAASSVPAPHDPVTELPVTVTLVRAALASPTRKPPLLPAWLPETVDPAIVRSPAL
jgi:hypothetical protein